MLKRFGVIALLLLATTPLFAAQRGVVAELITATWCPY
jgi:hypothetical protein